MTVDVNSNILLCICTTDVAYFLYFLYKLYQLPCITTFSFFSLFAPIMYTNIFQVLLYMLHFHLYHCIVIFHLCHVIVMSIDEKFEDVLLIWIITFKNTNNERCKHIHSSVENRIIIVEKSYLLWQKVPTSLI